MTLKVLFSQNCSENLRCCKYYFIFTDRKDEQNRQVFRKKLFFLKNIRFSRVCLLKGLLVEGINTFMHTQCFVAGAGNGVVLFNIEPQSSDVIVLCCLFSDKRVQRAKDAFASPWRQDVHALYPPVWPVAPIAPLRRDQQRSDGLPVRFGDNVTTKRSQCALV